MEPPPPLPEELAALHPADLADHLQRVPVDDAEATLGRLPTAKAAAVLAELEEDKAEELLDALSNEELTRIFRALPSEDAADLAAELQPERRNEVLSSLPIDQSRKVTTLLNYAEDTAGGIMGDRFITLRAGQTVGEVQEMLRRRGEEFIGDIGYLYVTDTAGKLVGIISLRDLVFRRPERRIEEIMNREVRHVFVDADQEEIARQFEHYHYLGLPVLERDGRMVGVVRASDALEIMREEATEDMQLMVGLSGEERALTPWQKSVPKRLPWLYVNLATAFLAAAVVGLFEDAIAALPVLAVFLPIVAGQGGNAGAQTLTIIIRDLALGEISTADARKALFKETVLGLVNGLAIGVVVGVIGWLWKGNVTLGIVVGVAMVLNMLAAALSGVLIPYGLKAFKIDPALASSIFVTTVTDVAGFFFFLGLATLALQWM
jgi:magnesium transporter